MSLEKTAVDTTLQAARLAEVTVRKIWSLLDAATENARPSETLSPKGVQAIQGVLAPGQE